MNVTVEITEGIVERARALKKELEAAGVTVVVAHPNILGLRWAAELFDCPIEEARYLKYKDLPHGVHVILLDGDLTGDWDARCLDELKLDATLLAPLASELRALPEPVSLREALGYARDSFGKHYDYDPPRTFACNHNRLRCPNCEGLVNDWIVRKRYGR